MRCFVCVPGVESLAMWEAAFGAWCLSVWRTPLSAGQCVRKWKTVSGRSASQQSQVSDGDAPMVWRYRLRLSGKCSVLICTSVAASRQRRGISSLASCLPNRVDGAVGSTRRSRVHRVDGRPAAFQSSTTTIALICSPRASACLAPVLLTGSGGCRTVGSWKPGITDAH
jgi:hypothetical protein